MGLLVLWHWFGGVSARGPVRFVVGGPVCFPGEGLVVVGVGDDVAVGVEGDRLACVAGLLGDLGRRDAAL